ncbi:MAG: hypothetical protein ACREIT_10520, partial [Tepidisphaeraceae bacterium]
DSKGGELKLTVAYYYLPSGRLVHRKKDAADWGVEPQIVVAMDDQTEIKVLRERYESEIHRKPMPKTTTRPATQATTSPATQPTDTQLQQAINTMIALIVFETERGGAGFAARQLANDVKRPAPEPAPAPAQAPLTTQSTPVTSPALAPVTAPSSTIVPEPNPTPAGTTAPATAPTTRP